MSELDEIREKIAQIEFCRQNCNRLYSTCQHPSKGCRAIFLQEKKQNGWPFVMADQILALETETCRLAVVRRQDFQGFHLTKERFFDETRIPVEPCWCINEERCRDSRIWDWECEPTNFVQEVKDE